MQNAGLFADYSNTVITIASLISLFVCLIPTTIGGLLSAIGIAGMDRALRANVITKPDKLQMIPKITRPIELIEYVIKTN